MKSFAIAYGVAVVAFLVIDGIWLGLVAKSFYSEQLGHLLRPSPLPVPAIIFYLAYTAGLVFLAVRPFDTNVSLTSVALYGALVGFLAYGTYDMTNLATLKEWPVVMSLVDMLWGTILSACVATISASTLRLLS